MNLKLKELRLIKGISQQEIADYLHCTSVTYSRYENGNRSPSLDLLVKLADYFDVTLDYLLGRENISEKGLTKYEIDLINASRKSDKRAKEDALNLLLSHITEV